MSRLEQMQRCYHDIMTLKGVDAIKEKVTSLHNFLKDRDPFALLNTMSDFLFVAKKRSAIKTVVNLLTEYLYASSAIEFCGKEKWFAFKLEYAPNDTITIEIERFNEILTLAKGFNRYYRGVIYVNIDKWVGHTDESNFRKFLSHLSDIDHRVLFIFGIHSDNQKQINSVKNAISQYIRIETLILNFPEIYELVDFVEEKINERGFKLGKKTRNKIHDIIKEVLTKKNFSGFNTIKKLSEDIIYHFLLKTKSSAKTITEKDLETYMEDSNYISELSDKVEETKREIGFTK